MNPLFVASKKHAEIHTSTHSHPVIHSFLLNYRDLFVSSGLEMKQLDLVEKLIQEQESLNGKHSHPLVFSGLLYKNVFLPHLDKTLSEKMLGLYGIYQREKKRQEDMAGNVFEVVKASCVKDKTVACNKPNKPLDKKILDPVLATQKVFIEMKSGFKEYASSNGMGN